MPNWFERFQSLMGAVEHHRWLVQQDAYHADEADDELWAAYDELEQELWSEGEDV